MADEVVPLAEDGTHERATGGWRRVVVLAALAALVAVALAAVRRFVRWKRRPSGEAGSGTREHGSDPGEDPAKELPT